MKSFRRPTTCPFARVAPSRTAAFALAAMILLCPLRPAAAEEEEGIGAKVLGLFTPRQATQAENDETDAREAAAFAEQMEKSIADALASHRAELAQLTAQLDQLESRQALIFGELAGHESQNTAHGQLLLVPDPGIEDLKLALASNQQSAGRLTEGVQSLQKRLDATLGRLQQTVDLQELAVKQVADIQTATLPKDRKQVLEAAAGNLLQVLNEKKRSAERYVNICRDLLARMTAALEVKTGLGEKLSARLERLRKTSLWARTEKGRRWSPGVLGEALQSLGRRGAFLVRPETLRLTWDEAKRRGVAQWAVFLAALAAILLFHRRWQASLIRFEDRCELPRCFYRRLGVHLLRRSLPLIGITLLLGIGISVNVSLLNIGLREVLFNLLLVLLLTRWGVDSLGYERPGPPNPLRFFVTRHLKRFLRFLRAISIALLFLTWAAGSDSPLPLMARDCTLVLVLVWTAVFWRKMKPVVAEGARTGRAAPDPRRTAALRGATYLLTAGPLALNLAGYENLAWHCVHALILTAALVFWGRVCLEAIREWQRDQLEGRTPADREAATGSADEVRWSLIQLARMAWFIGLAAGIVWAWDSSGGLFSLLGRFFDSTATIGKLTLSIKGILLSALIVFVTYLAVRLGRSLLSEKILAKKGLEQGLKDSILTIASYLAWGVGLVLALGVLGIDGTSLAVVFGAISIGIGFGLQAIFNNFISGLILLFERPIQVGDSIEINGLWAMVRKINVRATVVQTFDNSSVIIPNSEFISQRVTNWSFRDKRMRRNIDVGVAYGSDIDKVQETLLQIAHDRRRVYRHPKPDVLFIDHAASALIFRLRVWIHIDDYWDVPSKIRCEIDRRFRELGIEIAFPQQDLHIRTIPDAWFPAVAPRSPEGSAAGLGTVVQESA